MILIITHKNDFTADFLINKLNQKKIDYKRFNCEDILNYEYVVRFQDDLDYLIMRQKVFNSVWFRRTQLPEIMNLNPEEKLYVLNEVDSLIANFFAIIEAKWVSDPFSVYKAENKLFQLKIAQRIGFRIPPTLITNSQNKLLDFYEQHDRRIIIKPISQTRFGSSRGHNFIFTNLINQYQIDNLDSFDLTPCIFQKQIDKKYEIRVTVVGDRVFAASVDSQSDNETKIDWRKKKLDFKKVVMPTEIENLCIQIVKELNLNFGAIDIIKTTNGDYVFLEINPNGQWAWIEMQTALTISDSIIDMLVNE